MITMFKQFVVPMIPVYDLVLTALQLRAQLLQLPILKILEMEYFLFAGSKVLFQETAGDLLELQDMTQQIMEDLQVLTHG